MNVISLVGFKGSGKSTVANILQNEFGYHTLSFADSLKDCLSAIFCWDRDLLSGDTQESREWREKVDEWWSKKLDIPDFSPRWAMQNFGTNIMRNHFNEDIWVLNVEKKILDTSHSKILLTDCRFSNEIKVARKYDGKVIRIKREPDPEWFEIAYSANHGDEIALKRMRDEFKVHESEWSWIGEEINSTIYNNASLEELTAKVMVQCALF